jgi:hypothetical protein
MINIIYNMKIDHGLQYWVMIFLRLKYAVMKLEINQTKKTNTIKNAFNKEYPFLKLEFFKTKHEINKPSPVNEIIHTNIALGQINPSMKEGNILLSPTLTVGNLEEQFKKEFGLSIQVFRKQNAVWIETTRTDNFTLYRQNEMAKTASAPPGHAEIGDRYLEDGQY